MDFLQAFILFQSLIWTLEELQLSDDDKVNCVCVCRTFPGPCCV